MEFFRIVEASVTEEQLTDSLTLQRLPDFCASVAAVKMTGEQECMATTVWGDFAIRRETIMGGVRFYMPGCPNCLGWTVTTGLPPEPEAIVVHCVINRIGHDPEFIASLEDFASDWQEGLDAAFGGKAPAKETDDLSSRPSSSGFT